MSVDKPIPWEVARGDGFHVASNGAQQLVLLDTDSGRIFLRRGVKGLGVGAGAAERVLPKLNELAGELLKRADIPAAEIAERLKALAGLSHVPPPQNVEWAVAELDGVRVYINGAEVVVTRRDLNP
jgi:hypothetical protein